eukprot:TRINITY_DN6645_c0_g1_i1.p1 TRINITY_DN6645_c0_g1~~TRINITY_DN6645_c0_g1_i1.p1  ORF type:complete len:114 (-),score=5.57 TRINITY_DN6645_c0_g1_i1:158-499(-)
MRQTQKSSIKPYQGEGYVQTMKFNHATQTAVLACRVGGYVKMLMACSAIGMQGAYKSSLSSSSSMASGSVRVLGMEWDLFRPRPKRGELGASSAFEGLTVAEDASSCPGCAAK